jgi:hypothetical protein
MPHRIFKKGLQKIDSLHIACAILRNVNIFWLLTIKFCNGQTEGTGNLEVSFEI